MIAVPIFSEYEKYVNENIRSFINNLTGGNYIFEGCMYGYKIYKKKNESERVKGNKINTYIICK